jgi:prepilin-type N-terminal cleavage/methylation domain-containing protein
MVVGSRNPDSHKEQTTREATMGRLHDERGFSLLELLVVAAIIACLAVVAAPVYAGQRSKAEDVLLIANARNLTTSVQSGWMDVQEAAPTSVPGSIIVAREWLTQQLKSPHVAGAGLHFINPCTDCGAIVNTNKLPTGDTPPAVWITSDPGFAHGKFVTNDATVARLRGTIIVNYVMGPHQSAGQIEIYSVDRDGNESAAVQTVPMGS